MRFSLGKLDVADKVGIGYFLFLGMACLETKNMVSVPSICLAPVMVSITAAEVEKWGVVDCGECV